MQRKYASAPLLILLVLVMTMSACAPAPDAISMAQVPVHPKANLVDDKFYSTSLPWPVSANDPTRTITDGPYKNYRVDGQVNYYFETNDLLSAPILGFYDAQLSKTGWKKGPETPILSPTGITVSEETWTRSNQVIFLEGYADPANTTRFDVSIFLLTN